MHTFGVGKVHFADILAGACTRLHLECVLRLFTFSLPVCCLKIESLVEFKNQ